MLKYLKFSAGLIFLLVFTSSMFAQQSKPPRAMYQQFITDVFGVENVNQINNDPTSSARYKDIFENRILYVIQTRVADNDKGYVKLSEIDLQDSFNPEIKRDQIFNPSTFNPFKYKISFFRTGNQYIRIDNTDYMIVILGQNSIK